jgi:hypothetical protein
MCWSDAPDQVEPTPEQEAKQPDFTAMQKAKKQNATMGGGTLLTGPSGINTALNTGSTTLLGS